MSINGEQIRPGMEVVGADRVTVGRVERVGEDAFLIRRDLEPPRVLPFTAVREVANGVVTLMLKAREVSNSSPPTTDLYAPFREIMPTPGMAVEGSDRETIGQVAAVEGDRFILNRPGKLDVYVPFDLINDILGNRLILDVPSTQIDRMDFPVV